VTADLTSAFADLNVDLERIADPNMRRCVIGLLNIVQQMGSENSSLREENQRLRDEIARLKGEQGRPDVKPSNRGNGAGSSDHSSEKQRKKGRKKRKKVRRKKKLEVDRTQQCPVNEATLPQDAVFKGFETTVIQDVVFRRNNVAFEREKYYSPSEGKTYLGPLPDGYKGYRFGPGVRSWVLTLYYATGTSEPKILELLSHAGVEMSAGELSRLLIHDIDKFHEERAEVHQAGLSSTPWQQIDDTSTRVGGVNQYCHVLCNPLFTIYQTLPRKDRPTVLAVLRGTETPRYLVNEYALAFAEMADVSSAVLNAFFEMPWGEEMAEAAFVEAYEARLSWVGEQTKRKLFEAAALAAYRVQTDVPVVQTLLGDDARQFDELTDERALCWVHEGRLYKKLTPMVPQFQQELEVFLDKFWAYYRELRAYRATPSRKEAQRLRRKFNRLFSQEVSYQDLADRLAKTREKKDELLLVLTHPEVPLHNNASELGARQRVRKRDVSFGPRTSIGARAWDTMQSLVGTAKKLGVNIYEYFSDRVTGRGAVRRLAEVNEAKAAELNLGGSW
jgi:hypothetical protein